MSVSRTATGSRRECTFTYTPSPCYTDALSILINISNSNLKLSGARLQGGTQVISFKPRQGDLVDQQMFTCKLSTPAGDDFQSFSVTVDL
jgi:hypothetical protein